jgi:energy-coupling factor transporter ATP-binding protein EcfA2
LPLSDPSCSNAANRGYNGAHFGNRGSQKSFGPVDAFRGVDLVLRTREVLAPVVDNGAGKSTLIQHISSVYRADAPSRAPIHSQLQIEQAGRERPLTQTFCYLPVDCVISFTAFLWLILALVAPNFLTESNISDMMRQVTHEESLPLVSFARLSLPESIYPSAPSSRSAAFLFAQALSHDYGITLSLAPTSVEALRSVSSTLSRLAPSEFRPLW